MTLLILGGGLFCFFTSKELFPFAPYSMYSQRHAIVGLKFFRFFCQTGAGESLLTEPMIVPFDEARLTQSIESAYFSHQKDSAIQEKLGSLAKLVRENKFECDHIVLRVKTFDSAEEFRSETGTVVEFFTTKGRP